MCRCESLLATSPQVYFGAYLQKQSVSKIGRSVASLSYTRSHAPGDCCFRSRWRQSISSWRIYAGAITTFPSDARQGPEQEQAHQEKERRSRQEKASSLPLHRGREGIQQGITNLS